jgi:hypothetical protein
VPVIGIAGRRCSADTLPAAERFTDAQFDTEFVKPVRFALAEVISPR